MFIIFMRVMVLRGSGRSIRTFLDQIEDKADVTPPKRAKLLNTDDDDYIFLCFFAVVDIIFIILFEKLLG